MPNTEIEKSPEELAKEAVMDVFDTFLKGMESLQKEQEVLVQQFKEALSKEQIATHERETV